MIVNRIGEQPANSLRVDMGEAIITKHPTAEREESSREETQVTKKRPGTNKAKNTRNLGKQRDSYGDKTGNQNLYTGEGKPGKTSGRELG